MYAAATGLSWSSSACCDCVGPLEDDSFCRSGCTCMASLIGLLPDRFWHCALAAAALSPSEGAIKLLPPSVQVTGAGWETCIYCRCCCVLERDRGVGWGSQTVPCHHSLSCALAH